MVGISRCHIAELYTNVRDSNTVAAIWTFADAIVALSLSLSWQSRRFMRGGRREYNQARPIGETFSIP